MSGRDLTRGGYGRCVKRKSCAGLSPSTDALHVPGTSTIIIIIIIIIKDGRTRPDQTRQATPKCTLLYEQRSEV